MLVGLCICGMAYAVVHFGFSGIWYPVRYSANIGQIRGKMVPVQAYLEHGKPGGAFRLNEPGPGGWTFDVFQELAITLLPPDPCPADFDNSGDVGVKDLLALLGNWGPCP